MSRPGHWFNQQIFTGQSSVGSTCLLAVTIHIKSVELLLRAIVTNVLLRGGCAQNTVIYKGEPGVAGQAMCSRRVDRAIYGKLAEGDKP